MGIINTSKSFKDEGTGHVQHLEQHPVYSTYRALAAAAALLLLFESPSGLRGGGGGQHPFHRGPHGRSTG